MPLTSTVSCDKDAPYVCTAVKISFNVSSGDCFPVLTELVAEEDAVGGKSIILVCSETVSDGFCGCWDAGESDEPD